MLTFTSFNIDITIQKETEIVDRLLIKFLISTLYIPPRYFQTLQKNYLTHLLPPEKLIHTSIIFSLLFLSLTTLHLSKFSIPLVLFMNQIIYLCISRFIKIISSILRPMLIANNTRLPVNLLTLIRPPSYTGIYSLTNWIS